MVMRERRRGVFEAHSVKRGARAATVGTMPPVTRKQCAQGSAKPNVARRATGPRGGRRLVIRPRPIPNLGHKHRRIIYIAPCPCTSTQARPKLARARLSRQFANHTSSPHCTSCMHTPRRKELALCFWSVSPPLCGSVGLETCRIRLLEERARPRHGLWRVEAGARAGARAGP